ncbi:hypothetical protein C0J52_15705 [Blattella germanica]|nr:hypothetical protein C0J52_15705 [Blattella germanica]
MALRLYANLPKHCLNLRFGTNVRLCSNTQIIQNIDTGNGLLKRKLSELLQWYEDITGMHEVRIAQNRVLEAEEKFVTAQERRRDANKFVADIQSKLKDLYAELDNTTRGEERYVQLITEEHKILKEERKAVQEFQRYEREERDYFAVLSSAVKESHEKERAQAERTKYWSIIGSIIGTVIGVFGSSINNELKMRELRKLVKESLTKSETVDLSMNVPDALTKHEKELSEIVNEMKTISSLPSDQFLGRLNDLVHLLDNKINMEKEAVVQGSEDEILQSLKQLETCINAQFQELKLSLLRRVPVGDNEIQVLPYEMDSQQQKTQLIVIGCTIVSLTVPLLFKYLGMI